MQIYYNRSRRAAMDYRVREDDVVFEIKEPLPSTVVKILQSIDRNTFKRVAPILLDALEEFGCTDPILLTHMRECSHRRNPYVCSALQALHRKVCADFPLPSQ